ncbi:MAG: HAD hydrolase-like protein [Kiritimatiellae bacterium]|nr:HAD hydrolase-like protein [Kiritimatiellia bacterium]
MTNKTTDDQNNDGSRTPPIALVLELEFMLFRGRQLMYEAFCRVLKEHQLALDQTFFSRYCLPRKIEKCLRGLLPAMGKKGLAPENIADKIRREFESSLNADTTRPAPELVALLKKTAAAGAKTGLLSFLAREKAEQLMARAGLDQTAFLHVMKKEADDLPTPDSWLSLLKAMAVVPRCAIALVDGATACQSALAVGMRCCAVPDCFTEWQDFTGADRVEENISGLSPDGIITLLSTARFRERSR